MGFPVADVGITHLADPVLFYAGSTVNAVGDVYATNFTLVKVLPVTVHAPSLPQISEEKQYNQQRIINSWYVATHRMSSSCRIISS
jgi:hypothetical protein